MKLIKHASIYFGSLPYITHQWEIHDLTYTIFPIQNAEGRVGRRH